MRGFWHQACFACFWRWKPWMFHQHLIVALCIKVCLDLKNIPNLGSPLLCSIAHHWQIIIVSPETVLLSLKATITQSISTLSDLLSLLPYLFTTSLQGTEGPWASKFATAICGSPDIFSSPARNEDWWNSGDGNKWQGNRQPVHSINFVTAHDGFSLVDMVSFNDKHNSANGEQNRYPHMLFWHSKFTFCHWCQDCL